MYRVLVALLSAVDAVVAAAVGLAAAYAPLAVLWTFGLGGTAPWSALWPTGATLWQLGNLVPLHVELPPEYVTAAGIDPSAASFALSLAPLAFAAFTGIFAWRSGIRAARASAWATGVVTGSAVFAALALLVSFVAVNPIARTDRLAAVAIPAALYAGSALAGALVAAWRDGDDGWIERLRRGARERSAAWAAVPGAVVRASALVLAGLTGAAALLVGVALLAHAGKVIALYEAGHATAVGATMLTIGQLAYVPTLVVWGISWLCGPGFAIGTGTAVSPAGTQVGVLPGIPVLGILPDQSSPWLLLVLLVPVGAAVIAGTALRRPLRADDHGGARAVAVAATAVLCALLAAGLAAAASGSLGPERLSAVGPAPGALALALGVEVATGLSIGLFAPAPLRRSARTASPAPGTTPAAREIDPFAAVLVPGTRDQERRREEGGATGETGVTAPGLGFPDETESEPREPSAPEGGAEADERSRPTPLPPVD